MKTTLKQLTGMFAKSAGNETLPKEIRQFAAQLTILTAHIRRVEEIATSAAGKCEALDVVVTELANIIAQGARPPNGEQPTQPGAEQPSQSAQGGGGEGGSGGDEDDAEALREQMQVEAEEEARKANDETAPVQGAPVTPLRRPSAIAGPPTSTGEAS